MPVSSKGLVCRATCLYASCKYVRGSAYGECSFPYRAEWINTSVAEIGREDVLCALSRIRGPLVSRRKKPHCSQEGEWGPRWHMRWQAIRDQLEIIHVLADSQILKMVVVVYTGKFLNQKSVFQPHGESTVGEEEVVVLSGLRGIVPQKERDRE